MPRLIDAEKLGLTDFEIIKCDGNYKEALKMVLDKIEEAPTVDAEPVRHGRWNGGICSKCGKPAVWRIMFRGELVWEDSYEFCPHCGIKMDGEGIEIPIYTKFPSINLEQLELKRYDVHEINLKETGDTPDFITQLMNDLIAEIEKKE